MWSISLLLIYWKYNRETNLTSNFYSSYYPLEYTYNIVDEAFATHVDIAFY